MVDKQRKSNLWCIKRSHRCEHVTCMSLITNHLSQAFSFASNASTTVFDILRHPCTTASASCACCYSSCSFTSKSATNTTTIAFQCPTIDTVLLISVLESLLPTPCPVQVPWNGIPTVSTQEKAETRISCQEAFRGRSKSVGEANGKG